MKVFRFPRANNPFYPLPPDYPTLTPQGQRLARVNACNLQQTPDDLVHAWAFFRKHYLFPTPPGAFYNHGVVKSPTFHYQIVHDLGTYSLNAWGAPRSSAKSTVLATEIPLLFLLTRPHFETLLVFSAEKFAVKRIDKLMRMLEDNQRIVDDFGRLKPARGEGSWNHKALKLLNGSAVHGIPVGGKMLGERPWLMLFDDVEFDPALVSQPTLKTEQFEYMMQVVAIPMMEEGTCLGIIGTLHRRDFYLYHLITSRDPRYKYWNRRLLTAFCDDGSLLWKEKLSEEFLEGRKKLLGPAAFAAAYMNTPGTEANRLLSVHPQLAQYTLQEEPDDPFTDDIEVQSWVRTGWDEVSGTPKAKIIKRPLKDVLTKQFRITLVDTARTVSRHSDYSCVMVVGFENSELYKDVLWVWDMFLGKVREDALVQTIMRMSEKWASHLVGVEAVSLQQQLFERVDLEYGERVSGGGWRPRVFPVRYPANVDKASRICGLEWRFNQYRVKLPLHKRESWPFNELYFQVENFTEDLGLLKKDDAVDTLSMQQYVVRPRRGAENQQQDVPEGLSQPGDLLERGELHFETGIPVIEALSCRDLTHEVVSRLRKERIEDLEAEYGSLEEAQRHHLSFGRVVGHG